MICSHIAQNYLTSVMIYIYSKHLDERSAILIVGEKQ